MHSELSNIRLKFQCPANWDEMTPMAGGRFCDHCAKVVYDFTDARQEEFLKIMAEQGGNLCGRFRSSQLADQPVAITWWKQWLSAAALLISASMFTQCRQNLVEKTPATKFGSEGNSTKKDALLNDNAFFGAVEENASFPGGIENFYLFLKQNIRHTPGMPTGKVFLTFRVEKDGTLNNIKVLRGLNAETDAEAIRLMKVSPKWIPGRQLGQVVAQQYTVPINFN